ncbi:MAG: mechanosensitive ion channel family protein [Herbaspirillum sp.]|nr:mechanosensitive ion channel family protein [Herbaspirillum sp.]
MIPTQAPTIVRNILRAFANLLTVVILLSALSPGPAAAATADLPSTVAADYGPVLDGIRDNLSAIQAALQKNRQADTDLLKMRSTALEDGNKADEVAKQLKPALGSVQARLAELGAPLPGVKEGPGIVAQRAEIQKKHADLDAQVKLAGLLSVEAEQTAAQVSVIRRNQFQAGLGERTPSILAPAFWIELHDDIPQDIGRLRAVGQQLGAAAAKTPRTVWLLVALAIAAVVALRAFTGRLVLHLTAARVPAGRLRRSLHAVIIVLLTLATPALIALALLTGLRWTGGLPDDIDTFLTSVLGVVSFGGYVAGLGHALLLPNRPSWRLLPLSDALARHVRAMPVMLAVVLVAVWFSERVSILINAGLATAVAINCIVALLLSLTITYWLQRGARRWRKLRAAADEKQTPHALWLRGIIVIQWLVLIVSLLSLLMGYVAFGSFVVKQVAWTLIVLSSAYLLATLIDDACTAIGSAAQQAEDAAPATPNATHIRDQAAVLFSGTARLVVALIALTLLAAPFGEGPAELLHRADQFQDGIKIGEIAIKPGAVLQALLVLGLTLFCLRILKRWLESRYLPTTRLDAGMQTSAATLFGYAGGVLAVALSLSAVGIGLERIAWVASALSVGIGFGLQAIVQNFVSGLILLAERPVKVGDWVSLSGVEGDIRRINVRATEIQMGDRSTVIVPNSEFITKIVRNVTHTNPLGLVQIKLPLPPDTDADKAYTLLLEAFQRNEDVLDTPAPAVFLDGLDSTAMTFNATGFVSSPRLAYGARSALLFDVLKQLRSAGISIAKPTTMLIGGQPLMANEQTPAGKTPDGAPDQAPQQTMPVPPRAD